MISHFDHDETATTTTMSISSHLSDDLIGNVFTFLGSGHFLFVAGTSRHFYQVYKTICERDDDILDGCWTRTTMRSAVESISRSKHYLSETGNEEEIAKSAAKYGNLQVLKYAIQFARSRGDFYIWRDINLCKFAAGGGCLEVLQWLRGKMFQWDCDTCSSAARNGKLNVLQWARANGCPWDRHTCSYAAGNGHLEVLKWARANGCPWNARTCANAAKNGHLEVLQWARAHLCPWNENTCANAAEAGHLEVLQWARANGCPWGESPCYRAAENGPLEALQWAEATKRLG